MKTGKQEGETNHLAVLDVLRGLAILMVYFYHCLQWSHGSTQLPWKGYIRDFNQSLDFILISPLTWGGYGVAVFFVISGFCIHLSFVRSVSFGFGHFFYKRFWRIVPPFLVALGVFLAGDILTGQINGSSEALWQFGTHALLVHNFWQETYYGVNPSFWSIAVEAQLYAVYPLLWICAQKIGWSKGLAVTFIVELCIRSWSAFARLDALPPPLFISASPFGYWFSWASGAAIAEAWIGNKKLPFSGLSWPVILGIFILCWAIQPLEIFCFPLAAILTAVYVTKELKKRELSLLSVVNFGRTRAVFVYAGLASYSLYLIHQPLISLVNRVALKVGGEWWVSSGPTLKLGILAISVLPIFVISWFSYRILENGSVWFGRWLLSRFVKRAALKFPN